MADNQTPSNNQNLNELLKDSPFGVLLDIKGADGDNLTVEDIFGNIDVPAGGIPLGSGGNPFAGDNFWNIFNGGVNPANLTSNNPISGGVNPANLTSNNPIPIGKPGENIPFPIGNNPLPDGKPVVNIPFPIGKPGENIPFPIGNNPLPDGKPVVNIPFPDGGFPGGYNPPGLPGGNPSTPVPEPSSIIGIAVIGVGIAATKFRQYQRRTAKVFNK